MNEPSLPSPTAATAWHRWLDTAPGRYLLAWEQTTIDRIVGDLFGFHALQIGMPELDCLRNNRMPAPVVLTDHAQLPQRAGLTHVSGRADELPFAAQSVDLVVIPHSLEQAEQPHQVLREAVRVLRPEGQLVLTGFNPYSLWGLREATAALGARPYLPPHRQLLGCNRVKDWLNLLGLQLHQGRFGGYCPPVGSERWFRRTALMEKAGDRWWPIFGGLYAITAIKREPAMRLVGPVRSARRRLAIAPALAPNQATHAERTTETTQR